MPSRAAAVPLLLLACGCTQRSDDAAANPRLPRTAHREYRAIAGISMGAYGAMNLGTRRPEWFGVIGSLGGPIHLGAMLDHLVEDNLEVKDLRAVPTGPGDDSTFDHLPTYPDRDTRILMAKDLFLAFGNPFLHHPDPGRRFLASDSEPARITRDDRWGSFGLPAHVRGFRDGGDTDQDGQRQLGEAVAMFTDVLLTARGSGASLAGSAPGQVIGDRALFDLDGDGVFDVGDGIVINLHEPFTDTNGNGVFDPDRGETFEDVGLDGVAGTADHGEGNGTHDEDPDLATWREQDPVRRLRERTADELAGQRFYLDVGTEDAFDLEGHYLELVRLLQDRGQPVVIQEGFSGSCITLPPPPARNVLVRYAGGHVGIPDADDITTSLLEGDVCGSALVWQRLLHLLGYLDQAFPDGDYGTGGPRPFGNMVERDIRTPALTPAGATTTVERRVLVYQPPAFFNTDRSFPIVYLLGGYGQSPGDYERMRELLDLLIATDRLQNVCFAFLPGAGGFKGSFYVDHAIPHQQVDALPPGTGRYATSILEDLIPVIEDHILGGRIRH